MSALHVAQTTQGERYRRAMHRSANYREQAALAIETCREIDELPRPVRQAEPRETVCQVDRSLERRAYLLLPTG